MVISKERFNEIFDNISRLKIAVIGDVMLDKYLWGDADRISPEAPVPVIKLRREEIRIGGAANVADNLSVLGAIPFLISIIGDDKAGDDFINHSTRLKLPTELLVLSTIRPTTVKTRILARNQQVCRIDEETSGEISQYDKEKIINNFRKVRDIIDAIIISDYGKGVVTREVVKEIVNEHNSERYFVSVDPKEQHWEYYSGVDLIKPNHHETARATGIETSNESSLELAGWELLKLTKAKAALITTGDRGMSLFTPGEKVKHLQTTSHEVFDVTGAGDTVIAVATAALVAGASFEEAAIIANNAAGIVVGEVGTAAADKNKIAIKMFNTTI